MNLLELDHNADPVERGFYGKNKISQGFNKSGYVFAYYDQKDIFGDGIDYNGLRLELNIGPFLIGGRLQGCQYSPQRPGIYTTRGVLFWGDKEIKTDE